jgi:transcriptional regulator with XRE-family HTH domain
MRPERLQAIRVKNGFTQETLAAELKTDKRQVTRWENGESVPGGEKLAELAKVLQVSTDYLLGLSDDPMPHMRIDNMSDDERRVVAAMRRGEKLEAIRVIASDE